jgi:hypothetical protein
MMTVITILVLLAPPQVAVARAFALTPPSSIPSTRQSTDDKNRILIRLQESPAIHHGKVDYEKQSARQRVFSAIWGLEAQVNNGGFHQYFSSADGEAAIDVPAALRTIGAHRAAAIAAEALALFPEGPPPRARDARERRLRQVSPKTIAAWDQLDRRFMAYPDNLTELLYDWVKAHPKDFGNIP